MGLLNTNPCVILRLWLAGWLVAMAFAAEINSECRTTESLQGTCVLLSDCPLLYELSSQRPLTRETRQLLRRSLCGTLDRQPLVCCREPTTTNTTTTTTTTTEPQNLESTSMFPESVDDPTDVSSHQNAQLINSEFCGDPNYNTRLLNGNKTSVFEFPWMALLKYRSKKGAKVEESFRCGGTLINSQYVLTAAHCITNTTRLRLISVRLGDFDTSTDPDCDQLSDHSVCAKPYQDIDVASVIKHPEYSDTTYINDIALIRLAHPAREEDTVLPICLPVGMDEQNKVLDGLRMSVAGWRFTEEGIASPELLKAFVRVVPTADCHAVFQKQFGFNINGNQICAGGSNLTQNSCRGDSGSPLMAYGKIDSIGRMIQYGVVSYGHRHCNTFGVPGVYTRVGHYMKWILDNIHA